jgi:hypothetical protein
MAFTKVLPSGISTTSTLTVDSLDSVGTISATSITATTGTFSGNLNVAGVLTYEDVTNIDSVGLITARSGIHVTGGKILIDNNGEFALFEDDTSGAFTPSSKISMDFSGNVARIRSSVNGAATIRDLALYTGNSDRLHIKSNGNIGINQGSPSEKLEIYAGDILLSSNANGVSGGVGPNAALKFEYNGHQYAKIVGNGRDSSGYGDIDFYTSSSAGVTNLTQRMTIRADGKVGIGTDNPKAQTWRNGTALDVYGGAGNVVGNLHIGANRGDGVQTVGSIVFYDNTQDTNHKVISIIESDKTGSTTNQRGGTVSVYVKEDAIVSNSAVKSATFTKDGISFPSGQGIDFSATSDASGKTSELLDDYEEGTFTPGFGVSNGNITYSNQWGKYVKIGSVVYIWFRMVATNDANGYLYYLTNLPFTIFGINGQFPGPSISNFII